MDGDDLAIVLGWAADEGWNPGRHDVDLFPITDPEGFLVGLVDGEPVAAIACTRYDETYGFVGLYLVREDMRGRGLGMRIWESGHEHLEGATSGLDAVDAQVANYERSGYRVESQTYRYAGRGPLGAIDRSAIELEEASWAQVLVLDALGFPASRPRFLRAWGAQPESRALALLRDGRAVAYGVLRRCGEGHKIGPLIAFDARAAGALLDSLVGGLGAEEPWWIDVPRANAIATELADARGLEPGFRTSRMYRGAAPAYDRSVVFGVTTLELG